MGVKPCPRCRKLDRVFCDHDERRLVEWIVCTRCRVRTRDHPLVAEHGMTPNALPEWNAMPRHRQPTLFD